MILYNIGSKIRKLRHELGLSLLDVSKKTGMAKSNLSSIELNRRNVDKKIVEKILIHGFDFKPSKTKNVISDFLKDTILDSREKRMLKLSGKIDLFSGLRTLYSEGTMQVLFQENIFIFKKPFQWLITFKHPKIIKNEEDLILKVSRIYLSDRKENSNYKEYPVKKLLERLELSLEDLLSVFKGLLFARQINLRINLGGYIYNLSIVLDAKHKGIMHTPVGKLVAKQKKEDKKQYQLIEKYLKLLDDFNIFL